MIEFIRKNVKYFISVAIATIIILFIVKQIDHLFNPSDKTIQDSLAKYKSSYDSLKGVLSIKEAEDKKQDSIIAVEKTEVNNYKSYYTNKLYLPPSVKTYNEAISVIEQFINEGDSL